MCNESLSIAMYVISSVSFISAYATSSSFTRPRDFHILVKGFDFKTPLSNDIFQKKKIYCNFT